MKARRTIALICAIAYAIVFAHYSMPHDHHCHEQMEEHCHHHCPHHCVDQLSTIYILSAGQDDVVLTSLPVCAILLEPPVIGEPQPEAERLFFEKAPPLPQNILAGARGLRAPPAA